MFCGCFTSQHALHAVCCNCPIRVSIHLPFSVVIYDSRLPVSCRMWFGKGVMCEVMCKPHKLLQIYRFLKKCFRYGNERILSAYSPWWIYHLGRFFLKEQLAHTNVFLTYIVLSSYFACYFIRVVLLCKSSSTCPPSAQLILLIMQICRFYLALQ